MVAADISYPDLMSDRDRFSESHLDVTDPADWERLIDRAGRLDALVASAGLSDARPIADTGLDDWRKVMAVNLDGAFLSVKYGARAMRDCQSGSIVLIGSASGVKAVPQAAAYCASKAGMRMLAKAAALELKPQGVRVNCVSPAGVVTPMWQKMPFLEGPGGAAWRRRRGLGSAGGRRPESAFHTADGIS